MQISGNACQKKVNQRKQKPNYTPIKHLPAGEDGVSHILLAIFHLLSIIVITVESMSRTRIVWIKKKRSNLQTTDTFFPSHWLQRPKVSSRWTFLLWSNGTRSRQCGRFISKRGKAQVYLRFPFVLYLLSAVSPSLMHCFKRHQGNPSLSLSLSLCGFNWH